MIAPSIQLLQAEPPPTGPPRMVTFPPEWFVVVGSLMVMAVLVSVGVAAVEALVLRRARLAGTFTDRHTRAAIHLRWAIISAIVAGVMVAGLWAAEILTLGNQ